MVEGSKRAVELAEGHEEHKSFARLAHSELRAKGIVRFRDKASREYWISDQKLQIVLQDNSEVHYNVDSNSISILGSGESQFVGYEEFTGDFTPFVNAIGMASSVALSKEIEQEGEVLARLDESRGEAAKNVAELLES
jgi:hypothetical protein